MGDIYGLHAVIIKKPIELDEAKRIASDIIKDKTKSFYRETSTSYRFRNIPKQKFQSKSFRSKKIRGKPITLVFGALKPEFEHLKGEGILDFFKEKGKKVVDTISTTVKRTFSPRLNDYPKKTKAVLNQYGALPVKRLTIYRTPISGLIDTALNFISFGKWDDLKKRYGFDKLFHLALIANVGDKNLVIEKNEVVNVSTSYKTTSDTQTKEIPLEGKVFTVSEMLEKARSKVGDRIFFDYDAFTNNCQFFIRYLLEAVGLYPRDVDEFVFQDISKIYEGLPRYVSKVAKAITRTGAVVSKLTGNGEEQQGGSKASGYIRALLAKKFDNPSFGKKGVQFKDRNKPNYNSSFKNFLEKDEGAFKPLKMDKASMWIVANKMTKEFFNFVSEYFPNWGHKQPNLVEIRYLWNVWHAHLEDSKKDEFDKAVKELRKNYERTLRASRAIQHIDPSDRLDGALDGWVDGKDVVIDGDKFKDEFDRFGSQFADTTEWTEEERNIFEKTKLRYEALWRNYIDYIEKNYVHTGSEPEIEKIVPKLDPEYRTFSKGGPIFGIPNNLDRFKTRFEVENDRKRFLAKSQKIKKEDEEKSRTVKPKKKLTTETEKKQKKKLTLEPEAKPEIKTNFKKPVITFE